MRWLSLLLSLAPFALAADPATLRTNLIDGMNLSFKLDSHYESAVTKFAAAADFPDTGLGCSVVAEVRHTADLQPHVFCGLPVDPTTGKVTETNWKARIVYVEFADGTRWTPKQ